MKVGNQTLSLLLSFDTRFTSPVFPIYNITCSGAVSLPGYVEVKVLSRAGLQAHRVDPQSRSFLTGLH